MHSASTDQKDFLLRLVRGENWRLFDEFTERIKTYIMEQAMLSSEPLNYEAYREARGMILGIDQLKVFMKNTADSHHKELQRGKKA